MEAKTLVDRAYSYLLDAIVKGDIPPGTRLREAELSDELAVGRGPLREAIQKLEARKLVTKVPHVGAQVVQCTDAELTEIYQIRETLEALACELAAKQMTALDLEQLGALLSQHQDHLQAHQGETYIDQDPDLDFHFFIIQRSGNQWLIRLLCDELYHRVRMYRFQSAHKRARPSKALEEHQQIYNALRNRDAELASLLMKRHIQSARMLLLASNHED